MKTAWIALCLAALAQTVHAEEWPGGSIRVVVNAAPGGVADRAMRVMAPHIGGKLGAQIVVENRPGGEGYIGQQEVSRARPDGHTFLLSAGSMVIITPQLVPLPDFDPRKALIPVAPAVAIPMNLLAHPAVPVETVADFINYAKAHPGKLAYGSAGSGTALHIAAEVFSHEAGIKMTHVPYKGAGDALKDFLGGHVDVLFDPGLATQYIKTGRVKLLAVAGASRNPQFPDTPAMEAVGVKGVDGGPYFGIFAPKGTKKDIVARMNEALIAALERPDLRQQLVNMSLEIAPPMSAEQFAAYLRDENARYERLLPKLGIRGQ